MKNKRFFLCEILILIFLFYKPYVSYAVPKNSNTFWGDESAGVTKLIDPSYPIYIEGDKMQLSYNPELTQYTFFTPNNNYKTINFKDIPSNGISFDMTYWLTWVKISYAGTYKGNPVDVTIRYLNPAVTAYSNLMLLPDGSINTTINATQTNGYSNIDKPMLQFRLEFQDHTTGNLLNNLPVMITQRQKNGIDSNNESVVYGFDSYGFDQLYASKEAVAGVSTVNYNSDYYRRVSIQTLTENSELAYTYLGATNYDSIINLYASRQNANVDVTMPYNIYYPLPYYNEVPLSYSSVGCSVDDITSDGGKFVNFTFEQPLVIQKSLNFYPVPDTVNLQIDESSFDYLTITEKDFILSFSDGSEVVDQSEYEITIDETIDNKRVVRIQLKEDFAGKNAGKILTINQKSLVTNDKDKITNSLVSNNSTDKNNLLVGVQSSILSYQNYNGLSSVRKDMTLQTNFSPSNYYVKVIPDLTATITNDYNVKWGTKLANIPLSDIVTNLNNTYFPWDNVTAEYVDSNQVLNKGANPVTIRLTSTTFNYSTVVTSTVNGVDEYTLTYDGNKGLINGQATSQVKFIKNGTKLVEPPTIVRNRYIFLGWSTTVNSDENLFQKNYTYGTKEFEQKDSTLYARWEKMNKLTASWEKTSISTTTNENIDRLEKTISIPFYWNATQKGSSYVIKERDGNQVKTLKKINKSNNATTLQQEMITIDTEPFSYGENKRTLEFYEIDEAGNVIEENEPDAMLSLTITVEGTLVIESVPDVLKWTNRSTNTSIGILERDDSNTIDLNILDSREKFGEGWTVNVRLSTENDRQLPFDFVWKDTDSSDEKIMSDEAIEVMNSNTAAKKDNYKFSKTWNNTVGVLLSSEYYIPEGDYSNEVIIQWILNEVPN